MTINMNEGIFLTHSIKVKNINFEAVLWIWISALPLISCIIYLNSTICPISLSMVYKDREGNGTPLQYSCLENPMDGGAWLAAVHGVAKSRIQLSDFTFTFRHSTDLLITTVNEYGERRERNQERSNIWLGLQSKRSLIEKRNTGRGKNLAGEWK